MKSLTLPRALTAHVAKRIIRIATYIAVAVVTTVFIICLLLAHFFSAWWWLLIIPFILLFGFFLLVRFFIGFFIRRIHAERLTPEQRSSLDAFVDKIQGLLEARSTPLPLIVLISLKDLLFHRDIVTIRSVINDSVSLKRDYQALERLFS